MLDPKYLSKMKITKSSHLLNNTNVNKRLGLLLRKGIEGTVYTNIFNILSILPSSSTIGKLGIGYPFISTLSHCVSVFLTTDFLCKSSLRQLGFSERI